MGLLKILILEDVKYDFVLIKQELQKTDLTFEIHHATNQETYEHAIEHFNPDLILSDYSLPQYDGMQALEYIIKKQKNIPFIVVTGSINEEIAVDCIKAGASDYVTKEHLSRLSSAIYGALEKATALSEKQKAERIQQALFSIVEAAEKYESIEELSKKIHEELGNIIDNSNFYIALYHPEVEKYSFPFCKDKFDTKKPTELYDLKGSLTDYVRRTGKSLLLNSKKEKELNKKEDIVMMGHDSEIWIGAPLIDLNSNQIIGVTALQNYDSQDAFNESDLELLAFVTRNIGSVLARIKSKIDLQESEERFRNLTETATDGIIMMNEKAEVSIWNKAAEKIFGFTKNEMLGKNLHDILIPSEFKEQNKKAIQSFFKLNDSSFNGQTLELIGKHKNGRLFPIELSASKVHKNNAWHATGIVRDITERKKFEDELKVAKEKAEESDKLKTAFLANMSHEIRTPMNAILGFSELLGIPDISNEEKSEFIDLIQNNSNLLLNLINDIIDISKIEAGQLQIQLAEVNVHKLINEVYKSHIDKNNKPNNQVVFLLETPADKHQIVINSDEYRIKQVLSNLIDNALKYTEIGQVIIGYKINDRDESILEFYVKDTGIGIIKEKLDLIFERFRQADDSYTREYGGTGLGLTISNNIANLLGGDISVESTEKVGSTFTFSLPYTPTGKEIKHKNLDKNKEDNIKLDKTTTILIAEDVESNYQLIATYLKKTEANIIWVKDGKQAVEVCKNNPDISVILMDMQMPVMNGFEATELIKKDMPKLPIIAVTAFALAGDKEKIIAAGCDSYISKPIRRTELFDKLNEHL